MCSWVGAIVQAVGSDVSAAGNVYNLNQQAGTAKTNAVRAESAAADAIAQGDWQAANERLKAGRLLAGQNAAAAASGFDVNSESYRDVMAGSEQTSRLDVQQIFANAQREQENYLNQAADYRQAAGAYRTSAIFSVIGGALMAGGSAAQAYGEAGGWKKKTTAKPSDYSAEYESLQRRRALSNSISRLQERPNINGGI